ncbi:MAG: hypothetical protein M1816_002895 [Peltula sp. TS41687]|nr:MAG: hypothetical protein M1816_002895 [Peltula sp. TS41687]
MHISHLWLFLLVRAVAVLSIPLPSTGFSSSPPDDHSNLKVGVISVVGGFLGAGIPDWTRWIRDNLAERRDRTELEKMTKKELYEECIGTVKQRTEPQTPDKQLEIEQELHHESYARRLCQYWVVQDPNNYAKYSLAHRREMRLEERKGAADDKSGQPAQREKEPGTVNESKNVLLDASKEATSRFKSKFLNVVNVVGHGVAQASTHKHPLQSITGISPIKAAPMALP